MTDALIALSLLHWAGMVAPGPNVVLVSNLAANGNRTAALYAALGISAVAVFWAAMSLLGVHTLFVLMPGLRHGLQAVGGLYLCHVAVRLWRNPGGASRHAPARLPAMAALRLGLFTNLTNAKTALFFSSVFAAALPRDAGTDLALLVLLVVAINAVAWHVLLALAFSAGAARSAFSQHGRLMNRVCALVLGVLGAGFLVDSAREVIAAAVQAR